jgi:hypothetical protein
VPQRSWVENIQRLTLKICSDAKRCPGIETPHANLCHETEMRRHRYIFELSERMVFRQRFLIEHIKPLLRALST